MTDLSCNIASKDELLSRTIPFNSHQIKVSDSLRRDISETMAQYSIPDDILTDVYLMRFFIGNRADYDKALEQIKDTMKLRSELGLTAVRDQILKENLLDDPHGFQKLPFAKCGLPTLCTKTLHGKDKLNNFPILLLKAGDMKAEPFLAMGVDAYVYYYTSQVEFRAMLLERQSIVLGKIIKQILVIDVDGLGYKHMHMETINMLCKAGSVSEVMFAEVVQKIYITRPGWLINMFFSIAKRIMNANTQEAVMFCTANYYDELCEAIHEDSIPNYLGGTCENCINTSTDEDKLLKQCREANTERSKNMKQNTELSETPM